MYRDFIHEYIELGHMKPSPLVTHNLPAFYLPHHGVLREQSTTTKLRTVFNGSQKTSNGLSLKSLQEKGPNLQKDILALILKWRSYRIWLTEDPQKPEQIICRDLPNCPLQDYQLCTVTYGMKCTPWLVIRTQQLDMDDGHKYPEAAHVLQLKFYINDLAGGSNTFASTKLLQQSLISLLQGGGMKWRKWSTNDPALLEDLTGDKLSLKFLFDFKHKQSQITLDLGWSPKTDTYTFDWNLPKVNFNSSNLQQIKNFAGVLAPSVELKKTEAKTLTGTDNNFISKLLDNCSSLTQITRVTAWTMRFYKVIHNKTKSETGYLTARELTAANYKIINYVQRTEFERAYDQLLKDKTVQTESTKRVGVRLKRSNSLHEIENPVILPRHGRYTQILIDGAHSAVLHEGAGLTLAFIRQRYWIFGGNRAVKAKLRHCIRCHRFKPKENYLIMSDLPQQRATPCRPFTHTGVRSDNVPVKKTRLENQENNNLTSRQTTPESEKKGKKKLPKLITTILTLLILITGSYGSDRMTSSAHITSLESERPIYYDTIGRIQIIHDEWTLLLYHTLTNYWDGVQRLQNYLQSLQNLCSSTDPRYCQTTIEQLSHEMELLHYYNSILLTPHKHLSERKRRGLVNGIGNIAHSLFGILDQQFADKYHKDIEAIQTNENYLLELMKNQTSIVELANNVLRKTENNIHRQLDMIDQFMNQTNSNLLKIESNMEVMMATSYFSSASLATYLLLENMKTMQEILFDSLTDVYKGHMDVHLLSPADLIHQLNIISGRLPKSLSLPVENIRDDLRDIYKLLYVKARVTTSYFMFEVHIPLASDEDFLLYKPIPLPVKAATGITTIQLQSQYIAVNFQKNSYIVMTEDYVKLCHQLNTNRIICYNNLAVFNLQSDNAPCEAKLLSHHLSSSSSPCDIKETRCTDSWVALHSPNSWLALCCGTCTLRIICENDISEHSIATSTIVTLAQGCMLQSKDFTICSHNEYNTKLKMENNFEIPTFNSTINKIVDITLKHGNAEWDNFNETSRRDIQEIDRRIISLKEHEALPATISTHDIHQYVICYGLLSTTLVAIIVWLMKRRSKRHCIRSNSVREDIELQRIARHSTLPAVKGTSKQGPPAKPPRQQPTAASNNLAFNFDS